MIILRAEEVSGNLASVNTATDLGTQGIKEGIDIVVHCWAVSSRSIELLPGNICILHPYTLSSVNEV